MDRGTWLAGAAAATCLCAWPAAAQTSPQAPRSLFEASASPGASAPITMGFERLPVPVKAAAIAEEAPAKAAPSTPSASLVPMPPPRPAFANRAGDDAKTQREKRQLAARSEPLPMPAADPATVAPSPPTASAPTEEVRQKPMSRAEQRRAAREAKRQAAVDAAASAAAPATPAPANPLQSLFGAPAQRNDVPVAATGRSQIDALVAHHARLNNVPESLVHRIIVRESKYNARAVGRGGAMGLMQIKTATARGVGYPGGSAGLLDAETNLTYGVKYLAGAWRVAGGSQDRAVMHYARGYYYEAKRQGFGGRRGRGQPDPDTNTTTQARAPSLFSLFQ